MGSCGTEIVCELAAPVMGTQGGGAGCIESKVEDREAPKETISVTLAPAQEGATPSPHSLPLVPFLRAPLQIQGGVAFWVPFLI